MVGYFTKLCDRNFTYSNKCLLWSDMLSIYVRLELQYPKYPEVEPGGVHLIPQPRAAVALHNRAGTGQGTFQQLANQLARGPTAALIGANQTTSAAIRLP